MLSFPHTDESRSEPRGFSNLLNPSRPSGDVQRLHVHGNLVSVYEENGRLYHAWNRGAYPFPMDEVCRIESFAAWRMKLTINTEGTQPL
jgi:hypothetical protein